MPIEPGTKEQFFAKLEDLVAKAIRHRKVGFDDGALEENTKHLLLEPLFEALGYGRNRVVKEYHIEGDGEVDYLLKSDRPLIFVEAKSLLDRADNLFVAHREQALGYVRTYRFSSDAARTPKPVQWLLLTNFNQFHFIRANENEPTFSFKLEELVEKRELLWELLAVQHLDAGRIDELYDQEHKAGLDARFLTDLKRWRLILANGFALRNQQRSLEELTLASQQLLDRFIFCRMLEAFQLADHDMLVHRFKQYDTLYGGMNTVFGPRHGIYSPEVTFTFAEYLRRFLFLEIKDRFNTELFTQPLLCDQLAVDNLILGTLLGHEPLRPEVADTCGLQSGQGELLSFRHFYSYDFSRMSLDVMGSVYERFLAHKLSRSGGRIVIEDTAELRKKEGIYYTPTYIVDYIVQHTLGEKLKPILAEAKTLLGYKNFKAAHDKIRELSQIKVLDPAMGSGSFLLRAFDALADAYADYNAECRRCKKESGGSALFDASSGIAEEVLDARTHVITENIFGVDLDEQAVEVAKLNLWIRYMAMEKDNLQEKLRHRQRDLLPTLANNLKHGNSLIADKAVAGDTAFVWEKGFPEIMERGGFDVVIGNPPYVYTRNQGFTESEKKFYDSAFKHQSVQLNTFGLFIEHANNLMCKGGIMGFITPNNWLTIDTFAPLRKFALESFGNLKLFNIEERVFESADVDTAIVLFEKLKPTTLVVGELKNGVETFNRQVELTSIKPPSYIIQISLVKNVANLGLVEKIGKDSKRLSEYATVSTGLKAYQIGKGKPAQTEEQKENRVFHSLKKEKTSYGKYLEGEDVKRYELGWSGEYLNYGDWLAEPRKSVPFSGERILVRQIPSPPPYLVHAVYTDQDFYNDINSMVVFAPLAGVSLKFLLAVINSRLMSFWFEKTFDKLQRKIFPQFKVDELGSFPVRVINLDKKTDKAKHDKIASLVDERLTGQTKKQMLPIVLEKQIRHSNRTPCNLAHYLQKDFAAAVKEEKLIDDVQRTGFVHEIQIAADGNALTLSATVADSPGSARASRAAVDAPSTAPSAPSREDSTRDGVRSADDEASSATREARVLPVLRLTFKDDALREFIYASWRKFLDDNSRKKKWTTGKKPEAIYPLLANVLEPLVYFQSGAGDNLRTIRDVMKAVAAEAGSSDLAAIEAEIQKLDAEIDDRVYELYGLTPAERDIVEGREK